MTDVPWKAPLNALTRMASGSLMLASNAMFWVRDDFRAQMAKASEDLDAWNRANFGPDAETMGKATQIIYGLVNILPEIAMYTSGTDALARLAINGIGAGYKIRNTSLAVGSALFGTDMGIAERNRLINEGVDRDTANKAGLVSGAANALGVAIPAFLGASRTMSAIYGATSNVGLNMAELKGIQYILEKQDYSELSKQYDLNLVDSTVSLVMGAAMGAAFWRNPIDIKYERAHERLYETYKVGLEKTGKFTDEEIDAQAETGAKVVVSLARVQNIAPDKIVDEFAPKLQYSKDGKTLLVPNELLNQNDTSTGEVYQIIGERGVSVLDQADQNWTRTNNRNVALQMEASGKTPKEIRLATGWERGADGQWRYEIPDLKIKEDGLGFLEERRISIRDEKDDWAFSEEGMAASAEESRSRESKIDTAHESDVLTTTLDKVIDAPDLFKAYPQLRKMAVEFGELPKGALGYLSPDSMTIRLSLDSDMFPDSMRGILIHEIQHAIQEIEGFARGTSPQAIAGEGTVFYRETGKLRKLMSSKEWQEYRNARERVFLLFDDRKEAVENRQKLGLSEEDTKAEVARLEARMAELEKTPEVQAVRDEQAKLKETWGGRKSVLDVIENGYDDIDHPVYKQMNANSTEYKLNAYYRTAGEVEARNAEARKDLTPEERSASTLRETESFPRNEQRVGSFDGVEPHQAKLGEMLPYERKLAEDSAAWAKLVDSFLPNSKSWKGAPKGSGPVQFLRQVPLVFFLTGARPSTATLKASPHLFDGTHPAMTPKVLKQLPEALADPIALFRSATRKDSYVAMLELKSAQGATIVVPVEINARGVRDSEINIARSAYAKADSITGVPKDGWFAEQSKKGNLLYVDEEKLNRWRSFAGSNSLWDLSNDHGHTVMHKDDLVKLRESLGNKHYQNSQEGIRGSFNEGTNTIKLTPLANLSTFSHEHSHWYLSTLLRLRADDGATLAVQEQQLAILNAFGIKSVDDWNALSFKEREKFQEQFAAWTEIYLTEGKSPVKGLEGVFQKFGEWLLEMYKGLVGEGAGADAAKIETSRRYEAQFGEKLPELSPEVRKCLDAMYGAQLKRSKQFSSRAQVAAARIVQATRVNADKTAAPIENPASPVASNVGRSAQGKAASDLANGRPVSVEDELGDIRENQPVVEESSNHFARGVTVGDNGRVVVLQNRNRSTVSSVSQMNSIAADPRYPLLSTSRSSQSGAPMVSFGEKPSPSQQGKTDIVSDGDRQIPVTYYVVEADSVLRSNNFDGTPMAGYGEDTSRITVTAGNGRMAGITEAYKRGTAEKYREQLIADEKEHGVSTDTIRQMRHPVLVRYMKISSDVA